MERARGGARSPGYIGELAPPSTEVPNGTVWKTVGDDRVPAGALGSVPEAVVWERVERFPKELGPVAEGAKVRLAMHPADPPMPAPCRTGRLVHRPEQCQRRLDLVPGCCAAAAFGRDTVAQICGQMDMYQPIGRHTARARIAGVHLRNLRGDVPPNWET